MDFNFNKANAGIAMSGNNDVMPSFLISVDDPLLTLSSISDMILDGDQIVLVFPSCTYRIGEKDVSLVGGDKYFAFLEYLKTGSEFIISLCDSDLNAKSSFVANYTK